MENKRSESTITIHNAKEMKEQIKFLISFDHPDNPYFEGKESAVARTLLRTTKSCKGEFTKIKRLENDLFS